VLVESKSLNRRKKKRMNFKKKANMKKKRKRRKRRRKMNWKSQRANLNQRSNLEVVVVVEVIQKNVNIWKCIYIPISDDKPFAEWENSFALEPLTRHQETDKEIG
jgi:hypothetical protein